MTAQTAQAPNAAAARTGRTGRMPVPSIEELWEAHRDELERHCWRMVRDAETAKDLVQDTFVKAHRALPRARAGTGRGWLFRIASNVCVDWLRHRAVLRWEPWETYTAHFHPSQVARDDPAGECVRRLAAQERAALLGVLTPRQREALVRWARDDLSYEEIAVQMGTTRAAVKSLVFYGRQRLRQLAAEGAEVTG
jgi:RNA polymerase sigma factor (sigma-70 family)